MLCHQLINIIRSPVSISRETSGTISGSWLGQVTKSFCWPEPDPNQRIEIPDLLTPRNNSNEKLTRNHTVEQEHAWRAASVREEHLSLFIRRSLYYHGEDLKWVLLSRKLFCSFYWASLTKECEIELHVLGIHGNLFVKPRFLGAPPWNQFSKQPEIRYKAVLLFFIKIENEQT